jgi:lipopolysaccharide/colanic/teichoic acid biosynthesis glycosyltransferase
LEEKMTNEPEMAADNGEGGRQRTTLIVVAVVLVLLVCCCLFLVAAWFLGDPLVEAIFGQVPPAFLQ